MIKAIAVVCPQKEVEYGKMQVEKAKTNENIAALRCDSPRKTRNLQKNKIPKAAGKTVTKKLIR